MTTDAELVAKGRFYAERKQWDRASWQFERAYEALLRSIDDQLENVEGLPSAVISTLSTEALPASTRELQSVSSISDNARALKTLFETLSRSTLEHDQWIWAFEGPEPAALLSSSQCWLLAFFDDRLSKAGTEFAIPSEKASVRVFALSISEQLMVSTVQASELTSDTTLRNKLAYALAHLARARCEEIVKLYTEGQILHGWAGRPLARMVAPCFGLALTLRPRYAWALRHLGEMYRDLANSWNLGGPRRSGRSPRSSKDTGASPGALQGRVAANLRLDHYARALILYRESLRYSTDRSWAKAHLGAAIVNYRGFVGLEDPDRVSDLLAYLREGGVFSGDSFDDIAVDALDQAQQEAHLFYPWAEAYYACARLLQSMSANKTVHEGAEAMIFLSHAFYMEPSLLAGSFEPDDLSVNPFFQFGIYYAWIAKQADAPDIRVQYFQQAWRLTIQGLRRSFDFGFLPGVQPLIGFALLVDISAYVLLSKVSAFAESTRPLSIDYGGATVHTTNTPYTTESELSAFIDEVVAALWTAKTLDRFLGSNAEAGHDEIGHAGIKIRMGLLQCREILQRFYTLSVTGSTYVVSNAATILGSIHTIEAELGIPKTPPRPDPPVGLSEATFSGLIARLFTGQLSYAEVYDLPAIGFFTSFPPREDDANATHS